MLNFMTTGNRIGVVIRIDGAMSTQASESGRVAESRSRIR